MGKKPACAIIHRSKPEELQAVVKTWEDRIRHCQRRILDQLVRRFPGLGLDHRAEYFVSLFESYLPPKCRVLDIGGGWGFYLEPLSRRGYSLTVMDVVKPGFQKAPVVVSDGREMPFEDKVFDVSLMMHVLHHVEDQVSLLQEAIRVTRGTLIIVEDLYHHALGRWWTVLRDRLYNFEYFGHPCGFRKREDWEIFFRSLGLKVHETKEVYTWLSGLRILNGMFVLDVADQGDHERNCN